LLIEDDAALAKSVELALRREGMQVDVTDMGEDGLEIGKLYDHDIIILDLGLPDVSGHEVLRRMRDARIKTPVLIMSAPSRRGSRGSATAPTTSCRSRSTSASSWRASARSRAARRVTPPR
jgi:DNA-binding response OmpR family regulator